MAALGAWLVKREGRERAKVSSEAGREVEIAKRRRERGEKEQGCRLGWDGWWWGR